VCVARQMKERALGLSGQAKKGRVAVTLHGSLKGTTKILQKFKQ